MKTIYAAQDNLHSSPYFYTLKACQKYGVEGEMELHPVFNF